MRRQALRVIAIALLSMLVLTSQGSGSAAADAPQINDGFGLCFVSAAESLADGTRYDGALAAGAGWDRWPLYWHWVDEGGYVGAHDGGAPHDYDELVIQEIGHGLTPIVILLGTPDMRATGGSNAVSPPRVQDKIFPVPGQVLPQQDETSTAASPPAGLFESIFADGTDTPGPDKAINQANSWASFVHDTVERYKPGGWLATQEGWSSGVGVRHWEIWNEPDLTQFWSGTVEEYYRLLEVAHPIIKAADPEATVLLGGLAFFEKPNWLSNLLTQTGGDPSKAYFDVVSFHYYWSIYTTEYWLVNTRNALEANDLAHVPTWITESGVPVWDDFPATYYGVPADSPWRGTMEEQAAYVIQNTALAFYYNVGRYYHFMLHDDCGNTPQDAFGLRQNFWPYGCNPPSTYHPSGKPRPAYAAYQLAAGQFRDPDPLWREKGNGRDQIAFYRADDRSRVLSVWATGGVTATATVSATGESAQLYWIEPISSSVGTTGISRTLTLTPTAGLYTLTLPPATNRNSGRPGEADYYIGGRPFLLVERDTLPPTSIVASLPPTSTADFEVHWSGKDRGSGIASYDLWASEDGGPLLPLITATTATSTTFTGAVGHTYGFAVRARDHAGNEEAVPTAPQASTLVVSRIPVSGVVLGADGRAVVSATVTVSGTNTLNQYVTGDGGLWSATLPEGTYAFYASATGHGTWPEPRYTTVSDPSDITLTLAPLDNAVTVGDFEGDDVWSAWERPNGELFLSTEAFDGETAAQLGGGVGWPVTCVQNGRLGELWTLRQRTSVPTTTAPILSFVHAISTTQTGFDYAWLEVAVQVGSEVNYLVPWGELWQNADWTLIALDLSEWDGQTVDLLFQVVNCSTDTFAATLDRVSVGSGAAADLTERVYLPMVMR